MRRLRFEQLESRLMAAVDCDMDMDANGRIEPRDALIAANESMPADVFHAVAAAVPSPSTCFPEITNVQPIPVPPLTFGTDEHEVLQFVAINCTGLQSDLVIPIVQSQYLDREFHFHDSMGRQAGQYVPELEAYVIGMPPNTFDTFRLVVSVPAYPPDTPDLQDVASIPMLYGANDRGLSSLIASPLYSNRLTLTASADQ